jgi:hypothetical protein
MAAVVLMLLTVPDWSLSRFLRRLATGLSRRRSSVVVLVGLAAFAGSVAVTFFSRFPQPRIHDEFSYLLAADTFARGRMTNPAHPMWVHFESPHIIHQPTYASKYPPAQGLVLAAGQVIADNPLVGVWVSVGLACAAVSWMLMSWVSPRWALVGGMLSALHPLTVGWGQTYWGGAVAMAGGALVLGAFRRLMKRPRTRDAFVIGLGLAVLANSRPFEGLALSAPLLAALLVKLVRERKLRRVAAPLCSVLTLVAALMCLYNYRVTGSPFRMPYQVHEETYAVAPAFLWQSPRPEPPYRHKELREFFAEWSTDLYVRQQWLPGAIEGAKNKLSFFYEEFFPGGELVLPLLLTVLVAAIDRWTRVGLALAIAFAVALLSETWMNAHYAAPVAGLMIALLLRAMRRLSLWKWRGKRVGRLLSRSIGLLCAAALLNTSVGLVRKNRPSWNDERARIVSELAQQPGGHLVIVRYGPNHSTHEEWVYNGADIDGSKIVWARDMGATSNGRLLDYFSDRSVWLLEPDVRKPGLQRYPKGTEAGL